jgi:hypothetical protein
MKYVYTSFDKNFLINSFPETVKKDGAENLRVPGVEVSGNFPGRGCAILNGPVLFWAICAQAPNTQEIFLFDITINKSYQTKSLTLIFFRKHQESDSSFGKSCHRKSALSFRWRGST